MALLWAVAWNVRWPVISGLQSSKPRWLCLKLRWVLLPCGGGTQNLAWMVGEGWAKRMILCGERVDAQTAEKIGLVEEVVDTGQAKGRAAGIG